MGRVTAVFDDRRDAEQAVSELRSMGIGDAHLSFVSKDEQYGEVAETAKDVGNNVGKGVGVGAAAGALFGIAAALIPGAGPFIAAGALAEALGVVGGGAVAGAVVGGTAGGLAGAFAKAGYDKDEANYYGSSVERGSTVVVADVPEAQESQVRSVLNKHKGHYYGSNANPDDNTRYSGMSERSGVTSDRGSMTVTPDDRSSGMGTGMAGSAGLGSTSGMASSGMGTGMGDFSSQIREHMMVHARGSGSMMGAQGVHIGTVDKLEGGQIKLTKNDSADGQHHYIPMSWVERVDAANNAVILNKDADEVRRMWQ